MVDAIGNGMALLTSTLLLRRVIGGLSSILNQRHEEPYTAVIGGNDNELPLPDSSSFSNRLLMICTDGRAGTNGIA